MGTLDNKVENVKSEFSGDLTRSHLDYERATQGLEKIEERRTVLEETLKQETGFSNCNLPKDAMETSVEIGDVDFTIRSETRTKRPAYKKVVERMEDFLSGVAWLVAQGKDIESVYCPGRTAYIEVNTLLQTYDIFVAGIMKPEVKHTIKYETEGELGQEGTLDSMELGQDEGLTDETAAEYVRMDRLNTSLKKFSKTYEKALKEGLTAVTKKAAYSKGNSRAEGPDWAYVVRTLVTVPTNKDQEGELNMLADMSISKAEKERMFSDYKLTYVEEAEGKGLYVSMQSVYRRIQNLKHDEKVTAARTQVNGKEVV